MQSRTIIIVILVIVLLVVLVFCSMGIHNAMKDSKSSSSSRINPSSSSSNFKELSNSEELTPFIESSSPSEPRMVMIYLPRCPHCVRMQPELELVAQSIGSDNIALILMSTYYASPPESHHLPKIQGVPGFLYKNRSGIMRSHTGYISAPELLQLLQA